MGSAEGTVAPDDDLFALGMDSLRLMTFRSGWRRRGITVDLVALAENPTPRAWWRLLRDATPGVVPAPTEPSGTDPAAPFGLTPVQQAYWVGRGDGQPLGGVGCHAYLEFDGAGIDPERLARAVRAVVDRHGMLRARFPGDGTQVIGPPGAEPPVRVVDLSAADTRTARIERERLRAELSHRRMDAGVGEVVAVTLCLLPDGRTRLMVEVDFLVADVLGLRILLADLVTAYRADDPAGLPALAVDFPACLARRATPDGDRAQAAAYWSERVAELPTGPRLPLAVDPATVLEPRFVRRSTRLSAQRWTALQDRCRSAGITPAVALATAYAEVLAGAEHVLVHDPGALAAAVRAVPAGIRIVEVRTDRQEQAALRRRLRRVVSEVLAGR
ncbi:condensation domain-containing protein [Pseudonocardia sp. NPDC049635]|uniref:condensation domain-containing protein n=1 Tax=Pseudonocardia sp. NPDC049635 TaxID=3155506 RepID=UPI0033D83EF9